MWLMAEATTSGPARSSFAAVVITPDPMGLVRTRAIPGPGSRVRQDMIRMGQAGDGEAVFRLGVLDGVTSHDGDAGLGRLLGSAAQHLLEDAPGQVVGEGHDVQGGDGAGARRVDVAERVGGGNGAVVVGVVDHRREEVNRLHQRGIGAQPVDGGVVAGADADQQVGVLDTRQRADNLGEVPRTVLGASAAASGKVA